MTKKVIGCTKLEVADAIYQTVHTWHDKENR